MSIVKEFVDIIDKYVDPPKVYTEAGAYHILSSCVGAFVEMPDFKVNRPNTWFILSSIPGRMRRSTIIKYVNYVNRVAWQDFYENYIKIDKDLINQMVYTQRIDDGNAPGIADAIIEGNKMDINNFSISCPEIGDIIRKITNPTSATVNVDTLLSRLYYGESFNQKLSTRGEGRPRNIPSGQYVTMYSGMQEPHLYIKEGMSRQGLLRRIKVIYVKTNDLNMKDWKPPSMKGYKQIWYDLKVFATKRIVPLMITYKKDNLTPMTGVNDVHKYIKEKAKKVDEDLIKESTDYNIYQQTQWEYEIKLATLDAISKGKVTITMDNINAIQNFLKNTSKNMKDTIDSLGLSHIQLVDDERELRIMNIVDKYGKDGATSSNIQQAISSNKKLKLPAIELHKKLVDMCMNDLIFQLQGKDTLGRSKITWVSTKYKKVI